jgi:cytochrome b561
MAVTERAGRWSGLARAFHWTTAVVVVLMLASGFVMTWRGNDLNIWDGLTNNLYSAHKLLGFCLLWFVVLRIARRLLGPVPAPDPTLPAWQQAAATTNHVLLYALLLAMPLLGWRIASLYPALELFGTVTLPALGGPDPTPDKAQYTAFAGWHETGAWLIIALVALHTAAALYHRFVRRDGVFGRMWPRHR